MEFAVSSCLPQSEGGGSRSETEGVLHRRSGIQSILKFRRNLPCSFYLHKIILIHTKVPAPSKHRADYIRGVSCHGAPSRRALHGVEIPHLRRCRGLASLHRKHQPFQHSRTESNKTPTALPNPIPRARSEASGAKIKFFAPLSFKKEGRRRPPVKNKIKKGQTT